VRSDPASEARPRRTKRIAVAVGLAVVVLVAAGVTLIVTSGSTKASGPSASPAARRLVRAALKSTIDGGSFHYVSQFTSAGQTQTTVGDAGASSGKQVITIGSDTFTVLVIGQACYFQGDERQMVEQLGLPVSIAATHAGQWISLSPGDLPYQSVYVAVTTRSALDANIEFAPKQQSGTSRRAGYRVLGITGPLTNQTVDGQTQRAKGTAHLYVTTSRPHLPVQYTESGKIDGATSKLVMTFSRWGEFVTVSAPQGAVTYASLGVGNATTPTTGPPVLTSAPH
jgi:hypothetical protein